MEIKVKKEEFFKALSFTQNVVEKRSTMPILANVLLEAKGKRVGISATDLEVGVSVDCPAEVGEPGRVTVFSRGLFDIIRELPEESVHLKVLKNNWLKIECGKADFKIVGLSADDFPSLPTTSAPEVYVEERDDLLSMIEKTYFAMSTDETRYNLNGVYLQQAAGKSGEKLKMVATDGHRLAMKEISPKSRWKLPKGVIVPRKGVVELRKLLETHEGAVSFKLDDKNMFVEKESVQLTIRLIEGQFPPYEQVVPKENKRVAVCHRAALTQVLRRVALLASDKTRGVKFAFSPGHLEVSTVNPDLGEAREEMEINYKGETFGVGFNARYFLDVLGVLEDETAVLELKDDVSPCLIRSELDKGLVNVIMPMRI